MARTGAILCYATTVLFISQRLERHHKLADYWPLSRYIILFPYDSTAHISTLSYSVLRFPNHTQLDTW
jgi:hypothetical protein